MTAPKINPAIVDLESPVRVGPVRFLVVHTAECAEVDGNDDAISRYLARMSNASIHASIDNNSITPSVPENRVAWAASNRLINNHALQCEWVGRADQGAAGWGDPFSRGQMAVGAWLYARWAREHNIPIRHGSVQDLRDGRPGFYGHVDSTRAWHNPDGHYDPGPTFPWDRFLAMVRSEMGGPTPAPDDEEDEMRSVIMQDGTKVFEVQGMFKRWLAPGEAELLVFFGSTDARALPLDGQRKILALKTELPRGKLAGA